MSATLTTQTGLTPWSFLSTCPSYVEVDFSVNGSKVCKGMVRDLPGATTRRITNLTTGMEFFVQPETEFDYFAVTKVPVDRYDDAVLLVRSVLGSGDEAWELARKIVEAVRASDANSAIIGDF